MPFPPHHDHGSWDSHGSWGHGFPSPNYPNYQPFPLFFRPVVVPTIVVRSVATGPVARSFLNSAEPFSAEWIVRRPDGLVTCRSEGLSVLYALESKLGLSRLGLWRNELADRLGVPRGTPSRETLRQVLAVVSGVGANQVELPTETYPFYSDVRPPIPRRAIGGDYDLVHCYRTSVSVFYR